MYTQRSLDVSFQRVKFPETHSISFFFSLFSFIIISVSNYQQEGACNPGKLSLSVNASLSRR